MKKILASILILSALFGAGAAITAELQPIAFSFTGRWQPSEDPVLLDDNGLQDIQNLRKSGKHFKGISGHTIINSSSVSGAPVFLNGFHFRKDQPAESHVIVVAADSATPTASYLYQNTTAVPGAGNFSSTLLHTDTTGGIGTGRFSAAPQGNMVYATGAETLIWGGNEIEATTVVAMTAALTGASGTLTNPQDYSDQLRNTRQTSDQVATFGTVVDSYTKILLHADGTDGSTTITDAISTGRVITSAGSAQIDTAQLKFGTGSLLFASATTDSITAADNADWDLGSGDFTIDAWVRASSFPINTGGTPVKVSPTMTANNLPVPYVVTGTYEEWPYFGWYAFDGTAVPYIAYYYGAAQGILTMDFGAGSSIISTKYTVQASGTTYQPKTWTFQGSTDNTTWVTLDTQTNITTWSANETKTYTFANTTIYRYYRINVSASNDTSRIAIQDFQIFAPPYQDCMILSQWTTASKGWAFQASKSALTFSYSTDGTTTASKTVTWTPTENVWYHLAASKSGNNLRLYANGSQQGATQDLTGITISNSTTTLSTGNSWNGWIDEVRLSKGIGRWTSSFTVPAAAYTTGTPYWIVGFTRPLQGVKFYVSTANNVASTLTVQEWNGVSWSTVSATDNTSAGGISLAQTGTVTWPTTVNTTAVKYIGGLSLYWYQFTLSAGNATVYYVTGDAPMQPIRNIWDARQSYVTNCLKYDGTNYADCTNAVNDNTGLTYLDVSSLSTAYYVLFGFTEPMQGIETTMVVANENSTASTTMSLAYWSGIEWTEVSGLTDGTAAGTVSLSKTGVSSFQPRSPGQEFTKTVAGEVSLYYYKMSFAAAPDASTQIAEVRGIAAPESIGTYAFSETFQNRLFLFNEYAGAKNKAIYSVDNAPDIFNGPDSGVLYFGDNTEIIAAAFVYNVLGNEATDQLIVGKKNEVYRLSGSSPETWNVKKISTNVGVVAPLSMVSCEVSGKEGDARMQVVIWQGDKGFYMTDGSLVVQISDDIRAYFDPNDSRYIPTARRSKTVAWYDPSLRAYKALISSGTGQAFHNIELEYSLLTKEWTKVYRANLTPELITGWTDQGTPAYNTLTTSGKNITSAIKTGGAGNTYIGSNHFTSTTGNTYTLTITLTLNSGTAPTLWWVRGDNTVEFNDRVLVNGDNSFTYTETAGGTEAYFILANGAATGNWSAVCSAVQVSPAAGADPLQSGFQVFDTNGILYTYGGDKTGYLYRLENGNTFAGTAITQYLQTKDMILDTSAPMFRKSTVKAMRTAYKKKAGTVTISHYGDQVLTVDGSSNQAVPDAFSMATTPYNTQSCLLGPALYHSFKFTTSDTTAADGMELTGLGLWAEPYTALR